MINLSITKIRKADKLIIQDRQRKFFDSENKTSQSVKRIYLFRDEENMIRVKSRLDLSIMGANAQNPILIQGKSRPGQLIAPKTHE
jgi:hypothetical protein